VTPGAVVIGGASGIGAEVAAQHHRAGTPVAVWDVRPGPGMIECDVADAAAVDAAVGHTIERIGLPDRVTVCAGVGHAALLVDIEPAEWDRVLTVNTRGPLLVMRAFARRLLDAGAPCSMVATSSVSAHVADRTMAAYCASKAALDMVVKVAAAEWGPAGIRVNAVAPGVTDTPMLGGAPTDKGWLAHVAGRTPLGGIGSPADVATAILSLHAMPWVTGQVIDCDGGLALHSPIDPYGEMRR